MGEVVGVDSGGEAERKTTVFAPRIPVTMRQDIEAIQGITGQSVNEVGVEALALWMEAKLADETLGAKAIAELDAEQRRLDERKASIKNILGNRAASEAAPKTEGDSSSKRRTTRSADDAS